MINVTQFQQKIQPKLHGTSLAKLSGSFYDKMAEGAGVLLSQVRPYTVIRSARIANAIYDKVYNYAVEDDVEADGIIDIRPIGERSNQDELGGSFLQQFDIKKPNNKFTIEYVNGQKTLRLNKNLTPRTVLHRMDSLTLEGTITAGGDASNLAVDTLDYVSGNSAIKFDLDGATGTATITLALNNAIDLSDLLNVGALFEWLKFPDISRLNSVDLKWGSSGSIYWNETATAFHDRTFAALGDNAWGLLRHEWVDATANGGAVEANSEAIDYLQITINYDTGAALTNVKLDNITAALGEAYEVVYYSNRLFTDSTGTTWKEIPTASTDLIRLDGQTEMTAYTYAVMLGLGQELKGKDVTSDFAFFERSLVGNANKKGLYEKLQEKYPDQSVVRQIDYYNFGDFQDDFDSEYDN